MAPYQLPLLIVFLDGWASGGPGRGDMDTPLLTRLNIETKDLTHSLRWLCYLEFQEPMLKKGDRDLSIASHPGVRFHGKEDEEVQGSSS